MHRGNGDSWRIATGKKDYLAIDFDANAVEHQISLYSCGPSPHRARARRGHGKQAPHTLCIPALDCRLLATHHGHAQLLKLLIDLDDVR
jgi:hypothetical protein